MSKVLFLILLTTAALAGLNLSGPDLLIPTSPIWTPTPTLTVTVAWEPPDVPNTNREIATPTPEPTPTLRGDGCNNTNC